MKRDYKKGDIIFTKADASSEYQNTKGVVVEDAKPKDKFIGVSLVSENGTRQVWAVRRDEIRR